MVSNTLTCLNVLETQKQLCPYKEHAAKSPTALCRHADAFVQLVHLLNVTADGSAPASASPASPSRREDPELSSEPDGSRDGALMCGEVLATVTALVAGNAASRARVAQDIGYDQILTVVLRQARTLTGLHQHL